MANSYIPRADGQALTWLRTFAAVISAEPFAYMLTPGDAATIQNAVNAFADAYALATAEPTRTKLTVLAKNQLRAAAQGLCERFAMRIKANDGIGDQQKLAIGVRPLNRQRSKINCPATSPALGIIAAAYGRHVLHYRDSYGAGGAKPFGATELQLFAAICNDDEASIEEARLIGKFTRNPILVQFTHEHDRQRATYWARWASRRGEVGPWSLPVGMSIAA